MVGLRDVGGGAVHPSVRPLDLERRNSIDASNWAGAGGKWQCRCALEGMTVAYHQQGVSAIPSVGRFGLPVRRASRPVQWSAPSVDGTSPWIRESAFHLTDDDPDDKHRPRRH